MTDNAHPALSDYLSRHYARLKLRVARLLGSEDLAGDALQDTWLRLQGQPDEAASIRSPTGYLIRVAVNIAVDIQRRQSRSASVEEIEAFIDPAPGPAQTAEARSEFKVMLALLERLPERRRQVFLLVHLDGLAHKEVAQALGISMRTVAYELKSAHGTLNEGMQQGAGPRRTPPMENS
ncbi:RNA polymerase sigma factor [Variovorax sp. LT1R16]|uniref:RNA polymerase sigma factor n=1 Tax=Variovorax sp. LT1R16 TaxID=3443728 RepID=UPI003F47AA74